uniref:C2H2-type domain-containing protein n=1 Tax=Timema shepardi TaxID=629360 RepID=A0A7R9AY49_TIMSH|nr:unnamed protein product [Timema shepardi]
MSWCCRLQAVPDWYLVNPTTQPAWPRDKQRELPAYRLSLVAGLDEGSTSESKFVSVKSEEHFNGKIETFTEELPIENIVIKNEHEYLTQLYQNVEDSIPYNENISESSQDLNTVSSFCFVNTTNNVKVERLTLQSKTTIDSESVTVLKKNTQSYSYCHRRGIHSGLKQFKCNERGKCFSEKGNRSSHSLTNSGLKPLKCDECGKCFLRKNHLLNHILTHSGLKPFKCEECGKCFLRKTHLSQHNLTHSSLNPFKCEECGKSFPEKSAMLKHTFTHYGQKPLKCDECGKCFKRKTQLLQHNLTHSGLKSFKCEECGKCFLRKTHLLQHIITHSGLKPFKCDECGKCFPGKGAMLIHTLTHSGLKPFKCEECGKCFLRKTHLLRHNLTHSGLKPFRCDECGKCFREKDNMLRHTLTHSGLKPFKCDECGKCFREKDYMRHTFTHSGLKPPKCDECECFLRKNHILQHNLRHSGLKPFKCDDCGVTKEPFIDPLSLILVLHDVSLCRHIRCEVMEQEQWGDVHRCGMLRESGIASHSELRQYSCLYSERHISNWDSFLVYQVRRDQQFQDITGGLVTCNIRKDRSGETNSSRTSRGDW